MEADNNRKEKTSAGIPCLVGYFHLVWKRLLERNESPSRKSHLQARAKKSRLFNDPCVWALRVCLGWRSEHIQGPSSVRLFIRPLINRIGWYRRVISCLEKLIWTHVFKRLAQDLPYYKYTLNIRLTIRRTFARGFGKAVHITCTQ